MSILTVRGTAAPSGSAGVGAGSWQVREPAKTPRMESPCLEARRQTAATALVSSRLALETPRLGRWALQDARKVNPVSSSSCSSSAGRGLAGL